MKPLPALARTTVGFLAGATVLAATFVLTMAVAVARSGAPHGAPGRTDYWFGFAALLLLALGFAAGAAVLRRSTPSLPPARIAAIAGTGAVTLLMVSGMLVGELLGLRGLLVFSFAAGALSAGVVIPAWHARRSPAAEVVV